MIWPRGDKATEEQFKKDLENTHIVYDYDAENPETGAPEKWKYECWFRNDSRIIYAIHGYVLSSLCLVGFPSTAQLLTALFYFAKRPNGGPEEFPDCRLPVRSPGGDLAGELARRYGFPTLRPRDLSGEN